MRQAGMWWLKRPSRARRRQRRQQHTARPARMSAATDARMMPINSPTLFAAQEPEGWLQACIPFSAFYSPKALLSVWEEQFQLSPVRRRSLVLRSGRGLADCFSNAASKNSSKPGGRLHGVESDASSQGHSSQVVRCIASNHLSQCSSQSICQVIPILVNSCMST